MNEWKKIYVKKSHESVCVCVCERNLIHILMCLGYFFFQNERERGGKRHFGYLTTTNTHTQDKITEPKKTCMIINWKKNGNELYRSIQSHNNPGFAFEFSINKWITNTQKKSFS